MQPRPTRPLSALTKDSLYTAALSKENVFTHENINLTTQQPDRCFLCFCNYTRSNGTSVSSSVSVIPTGPVLHNLFLSPLTGPVFPASLVPVTQPEQCFLYHHFLLPLTGPVFHFFFLSRRAGPPLPASSFSVTPNRTSISQFVCHPYPDQRSRHHQFLSPLTGPVLHNLCLSPLIGPVFPASSVSVTPNRANVSQSVSVTPNLTSVSQPVSVTPNRTSVSGIISFCQLGDHCL